MSHNKVKLSQIIRDFIITSDGDDYANNVSDSTIRNFALRGIREIGFDLGKKIKSLKLDVDSSNDTISLPDDFVDMVKIGAVGADGVVYVFGQNKNLNMSRRMETIADQDPIKNDQFESGPMDIALNAIGDRIDDKTATAGAGGADAGDRDFYIFENYLYEGGIGRLYGIGGGHLAGEYRINLDQNRIEVSTSSLYSQVVMEYVADEARSSDPEVHVYAEEALRSYIYYKVCERKRNVPAGEKARARAEYYNERRKARARMNSVSKDDILGMLRKNFKQAPKY